MNKIKQLFIKDFQWKLISIILAVILWFVCINVDNPTISARETVMLEIRGLDVLEQNDKMLINDANLNNTSIVVDVRGKAKEVSNLKGKISAYIDLSLFEVLSSDQMNVPLSLTINVDKTGNFDFDILDKNPKKVDVTIDGIETATKAISVNDNGTTVAEGYAYTNPTIEPATVQLTGPSSQMTKIKSVSVPVNLTDATETIRFDGLVMAYDKDGKEVTGVDIKERRVSVTIPINKVGKAVVSPPTYTGKPAEGYAVSGIEYDLRELEIMGAKEDIDDFIANKIKLAPIDIEGRSATKREMQDLRTHLADTRLNLVNNAPYECNITVWIEPLVTKTFVIPMEEIEKKGYTLGAQIVSTEIEVEVEGLRRDIDALEKLTASVDLSSLALGENAVAVVVTPPKGITVKRQTETIDILVEKSITE